MKKSIIEEGRELSLQIGKVFLKNIKFCLNKDSIWYTSLKSEKTMTECLETPEYAEVSTRYRCEKGLFSTKVRMYSDSEAYIYVEHDFSLESEIYLAICIDDLVPFEKLLFYHLGKIGDEYSTVPHYYQEISLGRTPSTPPPPERIRFPPPPDEICFEKETDQSCWIKPYWTDNWRNLSHNIPVVFALFKCGDETLAILPVSSGSYKSVIRFGENPFDYPQIKIWSRAYAKTLDKVIPGAAVASDPDPLTAVEKVFRIAKRVLGTEFKLSQEKEYPEIFEYLGWCSWNAFYREIDEKTIVEAVKTLRSKVPIRFVIIDDGWQSVENNRLTSFDPDPEKFPSGGKHLVSAIKKLGVKYVGFWITLQGYWHGFSDTLLEKYSNALLRGSNNRLIPNPLNYRGFQVYRDLYSKLREWSADFTKVDNQYDILNYVKKIVPVNKAAKAIQEMLQSAAYGQGLKILNCMCMVPEDFFHWKVSNVSRVCIDYFPYWKDGAKKHVLYCIYNALWYSKVCWPDYDMFMSHDPYAMLHAVSRAISGGPVYITDLPTKTNEKLVNMLCFSDGRLLRLDYPALPSPDIIFRNPYEENVALKAFTKALVPGFSEVGLVAVFNINGRGEKVMYKITPKELFKEEAEYFVYEVFSEKTSIVSSNEVISGELDELETKIYVVSKIVDGIAIAGVRKKMIPPKGIKSYMKLGNYIVVELYEPLELVMFSRNPPKEVLCDKGTPLDYEYTEKGVLLTKERAKRILIKL